MYGGILWFLWRWVLKFVKGLWYAIWHGYIDMSLLIIPIDFESAVICAFAIDFDAVVCS